MIEQVYQSVLKQHMIEKGDVVLCGLSGGGDSVALCLCLDLLKERLGIRLFACHLNHGLRGVAADGDAAFAKAFAEKLGMGFFSETIRVLENQNGEGVEAAARRLRYDFFSRCAKRCGANKIATAHHSDDVLETALFHLTRGTGIKGLCAIPPVRGAIIRPLLTVGKRDIEDFLAEKNQDFVTDQSNFETNYSRNKIRNLVLPVLREINPSLDITQTTTLLRRDEDFLEASAKAAYATLRLPEGGGIWATGLGNLHPAMQSRVLRLALIEASGGQEGELGFALCEGVVALGFHKNPSARLSLPYGLVARRCYDKLLLEAAEKPSLDFMYPLILGETNFLPESALYICIKKAKNVYEVHNFLNTFMVDCGTIDFGSLCVRSRQAGDRICLSLGGGHKSLKRLMIEKKIPQNQRGILPVIADKNGVIAVYGLGVDIEKRGQGDLCIALWEKENTPEIG